MARFVPSLQREYNRYFVLPPQDELPRPPAMHVTSVRTGNPGVDALLGLIESDDRPALVRALDTPAQVLVRTCRGFDALQDAAHIDQLLATALPRIAGVHAVARLPQGYQPAATHLVILIEQVNPFHWQALGILEREGKIAGFIDGECPPDFLYPPADYIVRPPSGGIANVDASRRSGIPIIDAILDALQTGDEARWRDLVVFTPTPCHNYDYGAPCPPGAPDGTLVEAISTVGCHGGYMLPEDFDAGHGALQRSNLGGGARYAVVGVLRPQDQTLGQGSPDAGVGLLLLGGPAGSGSALTISLGGITSFNGGCGWHPEWLIRGHPSFLLAPP